MCSVGQALIISPFYPPNIGGAESFAQDLAKELSNKYVVHVCTIQWKRPVIWQGMNIFKAVTLIARLFKPVWKMTHKYKYTKVYALGLIPSFICMVQRLRFDSIMLALYDFKKANFYGKILNHADRVFVEGLEGKRDMVVAGVRLDKLRVFNHWCDRGMFTYVTRDNKKKMRVLFVGRPIRIKGKHIIQACECITKRVDKDIEYEYIEDIAYEDMPSYYQRADVVVVPSLYSEGFSKVVVEAATCGCIVVVSNRGALPEMAGSFGFVVEPTPLEFAQTLLAIKKSPYEMWQKQIKTALYAHNNFNRRNAEIFY